MKEHENTLLTENARYHQSLTSSREYSLLNSNCQHFVLDFGLGIEIDFDAAALSRFWINSRVPQLVTGPTLGILAIYFSHLASTSDSRSIFWNVVCYTTAGLYALVLHLLVVQDIIKSRHRRDHEMYTHHTKTHSEYLGHQYYAICKRTLLCPHSTCLIGDGWILSCWVMTFIIICYRHLRPSSLPRLPVTGFDVDIYAVWLIIGVYWRIQGMIVKFWTLWLRVRQPLWNGYMRKQTASTIRSRTDREDWADGSMPLHGKWWACLAHIASVGTALSTGFEFNSMSWGWVGSNRAENAEWHPIWSMSYFSVVTLVGLVGYAAYLLFAAYMWSEVDGHGVWRFKSA